MFGKFTPVVDAITSFLCRGSDLICWYLDSALNIRLLHNPRRTSPLAMCLKAPESFTSFVEGFSITLNIFD